MSDPAEAKARLAAKHWGTASEDDIDCLLVDMVTMEAVEDVQMELFTALYQSSKSGGRTRQRLTESDSLRVAANSLVEYGGDEKLVRMIFKFVWDQCTEEPGRESWGRHNGPVLTCEAMRRHMTSPPVLVQGLGVLRALGTSDELKRQGWVAEHGCPLIVDCLREFGEAELDVAAQGLAATWNMCLIDENQRLFFDQGITGLVLSAMKSHPADPNVQRWGCGSIRALGVPKEHKEALVALGAVEQVMASHGAIPHDSGILCEVLASLWNMSTEEANRGFVAENGALELCELGIERAKIPGAPGELTRCANGLKKLLPKEELGNLLTKPAR